MFSSIKLIYYLVVGKSPYVCEEIHSEKDILSVRRFHAAQYLSRKLVDESAITSEGLLSAKYDNYVNQSVYFMVVSKKDSSIVATSRLILPIKNDVSTLQMNFDSLEPKTIDINRVIQKNGFAEIASLVKLRGVNKFTTVMLYKQMYEYSKRCDIQLWLFGLNQKISPSFERLYADYLISIGESIKLGQYSSLFRPYAMYPVAALEHYTESKRILGWGIDGIVMFLIHRYFNSDVRQNY